MRSRIQGAECGFHGKLRAFSLADDSLGWKVRSRHFLAYNTVTDGRRFARPGFEVGAITPTAIVYREKVQ